MKKLLAILLTFSLVLLSFSGCAINNSATSAAPIEETIETILESNTEEVTTTTDSERPEQPEEIKTDDIAVELDIEIAEKEIPDLTNLSDPALLQYVEDSVYTDLVASFDSEDYIIEGVNAVYISNEYLEEVAYNSHSNIFFGYTLEELDEEFEGTRYVFTLGDEGATTVVPFTSYDDTYEQVIRNVAIGTGVILICVVVSVVTYGAGVPAVSMIFAASAKTATAFALSSGVISGVASGLVTGYQTNDIDQAVKAAALSGSEGFKWGAITGAVVGGISEASSIYGAAKATETAVAADTIPTYREAEIMALEKYGGTEQLTYLGGKEVAYGTPGATRPDIRRMVNGHLEAIEVKNYDLDNTNSLNTLYRELERQVTERVENLPVGSTQRIVLNVQGRGYSAELVNSVIEKIQARLAGVYADISVDTMGALL